MENFYNSLDELIDYIKNTIEYKKCLELKNKMSSNSNINSLIDNIKNLQKKYIKSNYDSDIKLELDKLNEELNNIPIYITYTEYLDRVNEMISYVNDELSDYFYNILNIYE